MKYFLVLEQRLHTVKILTKYLKGSSHAKHQNIDIRNTPDTLQFTGNLS